MLSYVGIIHKDKDSDYGISFPDLPGCATAASSLDELGDMAIEAISTWMEYHFEKNGKHAPIAMSVEDILRHEDYTGAVSTMIVRVGSPDRTVKANITAPESDLTLIDLAAQKAGQSRSGFMVAAAVQQARQLFTGR